MVFVVCEPQVLSHVVSWTRKSVFFEVSLVWKARAHGLASVCVRIIQLLPIDRRLERHEIIGLFKSDSLHGPVFFKNERLLNGTVVDDLGKTVNG